MKVLLAEDSAVARRVLRAHLEKWGYEVLAAADGDLAWEILCEHDDIEMAILDWMMPGLDGLDLCRRIRTRFRKRAFYILLCTSRNHAQDIVEGLNTGADDYLTKPIQSSELKARLRVGVRTVALETALYRRIEQLNDALEHVRQLQGLIPICMHCRRMRNDDDVWQRVETYLEGHADVQFSHGLCEECLHEHYPEVAHQDP